MNRHIEARKRDLTVAEAYGRLTAHGEEVTYEELFDFYDNTYSRRFDPPKELSFAIEFSVLTMFFLVLFISSGFFLFLIPIVAFTIFTISSAKKYVDMEEKNG